MCRVVLTIISAAVIGSISLDVDTLTFVLHASALSRVSSASGPQLVKMPQVRLAQWVNADWRLAQAISIPELPEVQVPVQGDPVQEETSGTEPPPESFTDPSYDPSYDPNYDPSYEDSRDDRGNHGRRKKPNKHGEHEEEGEDEHEEED
jgi:hypothetical protein